MSATGTDAHPAEPSRRVRAILAAVAAGRGEMSHSCEPDLFIDGYYCCDQATAHALAHAGLIAAAGPGPLGSRAKATLTRAGAAVLGWMPEAPAAA